MVEMEGRRQNPITPNTVVGEFPTISRLGDFAHDLFMDDSMKLGLTPPKTPVVANEILSYIRHTKMLLGRDLPEIDECMLKMKLESLHPHSNSSFLVNRAIDQNVVVRKYGSNGQKIISINQPAE